MRDYHGAPILWTHGDKTKPEAAQRKAVSEAQARGFKCYPITVMTGHTHAFKWFETGNGDIIVQSSTNDEDDHTRTHSYKSKARLTTVRMTSDGPSQVMLTDVV